jgi:hypothetical protein
MPKRSRRSTKKGARKARRAKSAAPVRSMPAKMRALPDDEALVDGCDVEFTASDAMPDAELPNATGGVETAAVRRRMR